MATQTRPYVVTDTVTGRRRLVTAAHQAQARNFVARHQYAVEAASGNDVLELIQAGVKPETATADEAASTDDQGGN